MTNKRLIEEVIWAYSTTGDDFQCVHADFAREQEAEIEQLRGNFSLAEEGLANATQEIERLKHDNERLMTALNAEVQAHASLYKCDRCQTPMKMGPKAWEYQCQCRNEPGCSRGSGDEAAELIRVAQMQLNPKLNEDWMRRASVFLKRPPEADPSSCVEADGCPTEMAVLKRFWREHNPPMPSSCAHQWNYFETNETLRSGCGFLRCEFCGTERVTESRRQKS